MSERASEHASLVNAKEAEDRSVCVLVSSETDEFGGKAFIRVVVVAVAFAIAVACVFLRKEKKIKKNQLQRDLTRQRRLRSCHLVACSCSLPLSTGLLQVATVPVAVPPTRVSSYLAASIAWLFVLAVAAAVAVAALRAGGTACQE